MNAVSAALVAAQFLLIALLASPLAGLAPESARGALGLVLIGGGVSLALWAAAAMRASRFSVFPEPREGAALIERGPYRLVRHPMYAAVLLAGLGATLAHAERLHWLWLLLLVVVLWLKIRREEAALLARWPDYADYRRRVRALVPGLI